MDTLKPGDTLVIYKPDRVARSMKELLVLLKTSWMHGDQPAHPVRYLRGPAPPRRRHHRRQDVVHSRRDGRRDGTRPHPERTLDGLRAAQAQGRRGGRPAAVDDDVLTVAQARRARGESVTAIARHLKIGRSTLYRALQSREGDPVRPAWNQRGSGPGRCRTPPPRRR